MEKVYSSAPVLPAMTPAMSGLSSPVMAVSSDSVPAMCSCESSVSTFDITSILSSWQNKSVFTGNSTKINALMQELHYISRDPTVKSIVFSQWTSMLDLLEKPLNLAGIRFVRLDGTMSQAQRQNAVHLFNDSPSITVFLISMKAGGLGLNLTAASRVFLLDPWWNPATEDQAIDRVHRIGQTREVIVYRFLMDGSVEERIMELQEKKRNLAQGALGQTDKDRKQLRVEELKLLFQD